MTYASQCTVARDVPHRRQQKSTSVNFGHCHTQQTVFPRTAQPPTQASHSHAVPPQDRERFSFKKKFGIITGRLVEKNASYTLVFEVACSVSPSMLQRLCSNDKPKDESVLRPFVLECLKIRNRKKKKKRASSVGKT